MSWWRNILGGNDRKEVKPDYYEEGRQLLRSNQYHEALTSFRLALKEDPTDLVALQQVAIAYTKIGMTDEAIKTYRKVLEAHPREASAHYGIAFLLLQNGEVDEAIAHLRTFLARPPEAPEAEEHVRHAEAKLAELTEEGSASEEPAP